MDPGQPGFMFENNGNAIGFGQGRFWRNRHSPLSYHDCIKCNGTGYPVTRFSMTSDEVEDSTKKTRRNTMNSAVKLALAGAMSIASLSGVAMAQTADPMVDPATTTGSTAATVEGVSVVRLTSLQNDDGSGMHARLTQLSTDQSAMAQAQAEVSADPAMTQALQSQSIDPTNVILVQTAANGGKVIYVR
jgi:hypothetical protein